MRKITDAELKGKGNVGRPDIPGVSTAEMQRIMDEIPREIIVPAFNELSGEVETAINERYTKAETQSLVNQRVVDIGTGDMARAVYDPSNQGADIAVQLYTCTKSGTVYELTGSGAVGRCKIPEAWASGDTFTVNGDAVPAYCGADAVDGDCIVDGRWVLFTFDGTRLDFNGGGGLSGSKLAQATASEAQVLAGQKFYAGGKALKTGSMHNNGRWPDADKLTIESGKLWMYKQDGYTEGGLGITAAYLGNAGAAQVLNGYNASSSSGLNFGGGMANNGTWNARIGPGGRATIPRGFHDGNGGVSTVSIKTAYVQSSNHNSTYPSIINISSHGYSYTIPSGTLIGVTSFKLHSNSIEPTLGWGFNFVSTSGNTITICTGADSSVEVYYAYYE